MPREYRMHEVGTGHVTHFKLRNRTDSGVYLDVVNADGDHVFPLLWIDQNGTIQLNNDSRTRDFGINVGADKYPLTVR